MKHETKNTTAVSKYCNHCGTVTLHACSDRRVGRCLNDHMEGMSKKQEADAKKREAEEREPKLL